MEFIQFVCEADHFGEALPQGDPTLSLHEGLWAYCARGSRQHHRWEGVTRTTLLALERETYRRAQPYIRSAAQQTAAA